MSLLKSLRSEILKTKRTAPLYLTIGAAAFAPFMSMLELLMDGFDSEDKNNIYTEMMIRKFEITGLVALPIFIILICTLLPQIEYKNNTWKQVLASPQNKIDVFTAKFIDVQLLVLVFFITNTLLMYLSTVILHFMHPSLDVFNQPLDGYKLLMARVNSYISLLALCAIQFWLGLKFKNFIAPIGIGIGCWFAGTILVIQNFDIAAYFPYSFHGFGKVPNYNPLNNSVGAASLIYAALFLVIGFWDFPTSSPSGWNGAVRAGS